MKSSFGIVFLFVFIFCKGWAQSPMADFSVSATACSFEKLDLKNQSAGYSNIEWDFCEEDLLSAPVYLDRGVIPGELGSLDIRFYLDGTSWYGFLCDANGNKVSRLSFGNSLTNTPVIDKLGDFIVPGGVELAKVNGEWYGLVGTFNFPSMLYLFRFGSSLGNTPQIVLVDLPPNTLLSPRTIRLVQEGTRFIAFIANFNQPKIMRVDFGTSLSKTVSSVDLIDIGVSNLVGMDAVDDGFGKYLLVTGSTSNLLLKISFGSSWQNVSSGELVSLAGINLTKPGLIKIEYEGGRYYAMLVEDGGRLLRMDFGSSLSSSTPTIVSLGLFPGLQQVNGMDIQRRDGGYTVLLTSYLANHLHQIDFNSTSCVSSLAYFEGATPPLVSYSSQGTFPITLRVKDDALLQSKITREVTVSALNSPLITLNKLNRQCQSLENEFSVSSSATLSNYNWKLGDGTSSLSSVAQHSYSTPAKYKVEVEVTSTNGCKNRAADEVAIFFPPSFSLPSITTLCTNQAYKFENTTAYAIGLTTQWEWLVNDVAEANSADLDYVFTTQTSATVKLKASNGECSSEAAQTITSFNQGPLVEFQVGNGCMGTSLPFNNSTTGVVVGYQWEFGDGTFSTQQSPSKSYSVSGDYSIKLTASNALGCDNFKTKRITIYSKPQPDFSIGLPPFSCAGSSSQFTDLTPAPTDSNITSWTWGFGDAANGSSLVKNPSYTYATANTYNVSLAVVTNFGCTNSIQKAVTISPSPVAGFSNLPACVNQTTQFADASSGSIKSRLWQIQSSTFITPNPQFVFPSAGSFPVVLTVTGNNNCVSQASKNIVVPVVPSLDFSVQAPCANSPTVFTELTTSVDPSISKSWSFGSQGTGSGSPVQYTFSSTGTYVVQLNSTRQSGCVYSVSKNVSIVSPPVADFVPSIDAGAAPLPVSFANNSSGANSYLWKFGDQGNSTSVLVSPTFVFSELGSYNVELSASNSLGCTNRLSKPISVVVPNVDAEMTDFFFVKDPKTGSLQPVVRLLNRSNITLTNPIILLDVAGGSGVSQQLTGAIKPNQEVSQMLDLKLVPKTNQYVCAEVVVAGDVDTFLNRKCLSLSGEEVLFAPFPNPAREQLNMDWISIDSSAVTFQVLTSAGAVSFQQTISSINPGLNRLVINTSTLLSGTYFIRFRDRTNDRTFSLVVLGN